MKTHHTFSLLTLLSATALFHLHPIPAAAHSDNPAAAAANSSSTDFIRISCKATLYPDLCYTSLAGYASAVQADPGRLARLAITVSLARASRTAQYLSNLSRTTDYGSNPRVAAALHDCSSVFGDAVDQILGSLHQMRHLGSTSASSESLRFRMSNVQTWMSAALTNEETCTEGFEDIPDCTVKTDVTDRVVKVKEVSSNALALVNSYAAKVKVP